MKFNALWWWIDRWRKSTAYTDMTLEQQGAYRNLLDEANLRGGALPNDERILAKACGDARVWRRVRTAVLSRFELREDGLHNATLDAVIQESKRRAEKQQRYRNKRGNGTGNAGGNTSGSPDPDPITNPTLPEKPPGELKRARLAFAGKVLEIPKFLDDEFVRRLNGEFFELTRFYLALDTRLTQTGEAWDLRWIRDQFAKEAPQPERVNGQRQRRIAEQLTSRRSWRLDCHHEPPCSSYDWHCIRLERETATP